MQIGFTRHSNNPKKQDRLGKIHEIERFMENMLFFAIKLGFGIFRLAFLQKGISL